jgi:hypothetical protein
MGYNYEIDVHLLTPAGDELIDRMGLFEELLPSLRPERGWDPTSYPFLKACVIDDLIGRGHLEDAKWSKEQLDPLFTELSYQVPDYIWRLEWMGDNAFDRFRQYWFRGNKEEYQAKFSVSWPSVNLDKLRKQ